MSKSSSFQETNRISAQVDNSPDMMLIPAGPFLMGSDNGAEFERPVHEVYLGDFLLGAAPVTNREFRRFVLETGGS